LFHQTGLKKLLFGPGIAVRIPPMEKVSARRFVTPRWIAAGVLVLLAVVLSTWYGVSGREDLILNAAQRERLGGTYVRLPDGVTHYEDTGPEDGPAVILLHGATIPSWGWDFQAEALADAGMRVVRYDQFGRGWSDRPPGEYDTAFYVRQLEDLIEALEIKGKLALVGHSLGGAIAARYAAVHPEQIDRIAFVAPVINSIENRTPFQVARIPVVGAFTVRTIILGVLTSRASSFFAKIGNGARRYDELYQEQMRYSGFERSLLSQFRSDVVDDHREAYAALALMDAPIMLAWGTLDEDIPREHVDHVKDTLPRLELHVLEGVGHSPTMEAPGELNRILVGFLVD